MIDGITLFIGAALAVGAWIWFDALRAREAAVAGAGKACRDAGVQLLDQTVRLSRMRLTRSLQGGLSWRRYYHFDFSEGGVDRHPGTVLLLGFRTSQVVLEGERLGRLVIGSSVELEC
ncbi:MAG: DUF3301 domain-containing protein [Pseudomonadota bacterium]